MNQKLKLEAEKYMTFRNGRWQWDLSKSEKIRAERKAQPHVRKQGNISIINKGGQRVIIEKRVLTSPHPAEARQAIKTLRNSFNFIDNIFSTKSHK